MFDDGVANGSRILTGGQRPRESSKSLQTMAPANVKSSGFCGP